MERVSREAKVSEEVRGLLVDLYREADPDLNDGKPLDPVELVERGAKRVLHRLDDRPDLQAPLLESLGEILQHLGDPGGATRLFQAAYDLRQATFGSEAVETWRAQDKLAYATAESGFVDDAVPLLEQSLAVQRRLLGADHPDLASPLAHLGAAYAMQLRPDEAVSCFQEMQELRDGGARQIEDGGLDLLLAVALAQGGAVQAAIDVYESALRTRIESGTDLHDLGTIRADLGVLLLRSGDVDRASGLIRQGVQELGERYGERHEKTLAARRSLGELYLEQDRLDEAESELRGVVADGVDERGNLKRTALNAKLVLADVLRQLERFEESRELLNESAGPSEAYGDSSPIRLTHLYYLGRLNNDTGRHADAEQPLRTALENWTESAGATFSIHPYFVYQLAFSLSEQGRQEEACDLLLKYLEEADRITASDPLFVFTYHLKLGNILQTVGDVRACLSVLEPALPLADSAGVEQRLDYLHLLAWALTEGGRGQEAIPFLREVVTGRTSVSGPLYYRTLQAENGLAHLLGLHGHAEEAERRYLDLLPRAIQSYGWDSDDVAWFRYRYAGFLAREGRLTDAQEVLRGALADAGEVPSRADLQTLADEVNARNEGGAGRVYVLVLRADAGGGGLASFSHQESQKKDSSRTEELTPPPMAPG